MAGDGVAGGEITGEAAAAEDCAFIASISVS
jgi:hypothetical protein